VLIALGHDAGHLRPLPIRAKINLVGVSLGSLWESISIAPADMPVPPGSRSL